MNTVHWPPQERVTAEVIRTMDEAENTTFNTTTTCGKTSISSSSSSFLVEKEIRCQDDQKQQQDMKHGINCRRCSSTNTKFCYYNNYSLSQPRYFCKTCKRYWTEGGSLRNIPVGGVSRKNMKRSSPSNSNSDTNSSPPPPPQQQQQQQLSSPMSKKMFLDQYHDDNINYNQQSLSLQVQRPSQQQQAAPFAHNQNPNIHIAGEQGREIIRHDLNLGLIPSEQNVFKTITELIQVPDFDKNNTLFQQYPLFMPTTISSSNNNYHQLGNFHDQEEDNRRSPALLFPFQDIKQVERKTSDSAAGYRINGGTVLGSGLW